MSELEEVLWAVSHLLLTPQGRRWPSKPTPGVALPYVYVLLFAVASGDISPSLHMAHTFPVTLLHFTPSEASTALNMLVPFSGVSFPGNVSKSRWPPSGALKQASSLWPQQKPISTGFQLSKWPRCSLSLVLQRLPCTHHPFFLPRQTPVFWELCVQTCCFLHKFPESL